LVAGVADGFDDGVEGGERAERGTRHEAAVSGEVAEIGENIGVITGKIHLRLNGIGLKERSEQANSR
jgi:hypothetical protein